jgi:hypothetical protein
LKYSWVLLLLFNLVLGVSSVDFNAQQTGQDVEGAIKIYLMASYGPGLDVPAAGPELIAYKITSKGEICTHKNAVMSKQLDPAVDSAAAEAELTASEPPADALCSDRALTGGIYTLLAAKLDQANWATWKCYAKPLEGVVSAAAAGPLKMYSMQSVQFAAGNSYTCIATYTRMTSEEQQAQASISWSDQVARAASMPVLDAEVNAASAVPTADRGVMATSGSCAPLGYTQPPRGKPPPPLKIAGHKLVDAVTNKAVPIRGLNW